MRKYIARMPIEDGVRQMLLTTFKPIHDHVYARAITIAYGVSNTFKVGEDRFRIIIYGIHRDFDTQALLCAVAGMYTQDSLQLHLGNRPIGNGTPLHLTLSVAPGTKPSQAADLRGGRVQYLDSVIEFGAKPVLELIKETAPESRQLWA